MARLLAFPRLELATCWKRPLYIVMLVLFALMTLGLMSGDVMIGVGASTAGGPKSSVNSAFNIAFIDIVLFSLILPFFVAIACGMPLLVDADGKASRLILATPMSHAEYALSRFLGAISVIAVVIALWCAVQMGVHELYPIDANKASRGGFAAWNYIQPLLVFTVPFAIFIGGVSMWLGVRTRQPVLVFTLPVVVVISGISLVWTFNPSWLPSWVDQLLRHIDPTGFRWFFLTFGREDRGVAFYNEAPLELPALFAWSRVAIAAVGIAAVCATGRRLARTERADARVRDREGELAKARQASAAAPALALVGTRAALLPRSVAVPPGFIRGTIAVAALETRALLRSPGVWLFGPLILLQAWGMMSFREGAFETELLMTTGAAAATVFNTLTLLLCLLVLVYTVESLVREDRCGLSGIFRASPTMSGSMLAGKVLANALMASMIVVFASIGVALTLLIQRVQTGIPVPFEPATLLLILGVLLAPTLVLWSSFVCFLHALLPHRLAVYAVALAALTGTGLATQFDYVNWVTKWHLWSAVRWSELDRLAFMWPAIVGNRLLVLAAAAFFIVATLRCWPRRRRDWRATMDRARPGVVLRGAIPLLAAAAPVVAIGGYAGLSVRNGFEGEPQRNAQQAYWKRNARTWEDVPLPAVDSVDGEVRLHPERREIEVAATMVLRNPHRSPMPQVPVTVGWHLTSSDWTVDGVATDPEKKDQTAPSIENRSGLYVITPATPLATDQTVTISFKLRGKVPSGWSRRGTGVPEFVLPSGVVLTSFGPSFLPVAGFMDGIGVGEENARDAREYPLEHWKSRVDPGFGPAWPTRVRLAVEGPEDWTMNVVGVEREVSVKDGRRRVVWETDHPVRFFNIVGGPLERKDGEEVSVFYSRRTPENVDSMVDALAAARKRYAAWFGPYPWANLRVTEFPGLSEYAQGFPGNISFSEGIGFLARPLRRHDEQESTLDVPYYIVAHEAGHQWWGNIVMPGKGPGGNIVSEGLAEFSAVMLVHHELGQRQAQTLRRRWERGYTDGRSEDNERPINRTDGSRPGDQVVTYQRSGFVLWMLRDLMGEDAMVTGLRDFVAKWKDGVKTPEGLDFPLIEDLVASLRVTAPDVARFDDFVAQWIYGTALPRLKIEQPAVATTPSGGFSTTAVLRNEGSGTVDVVVRVEGPKADDVATDGASKEPPFAQVVVRVAPGSAIDVVVPSEFQPRRIIVDPDVHLLFVGRKACDLAL